MPYSMADNMQIRDPYDLCNNASLSRRHFLWQAGGGLGAIALAWMLDQESRGALPVDDGASDSYDPKPPHFSAKAKRVVQIFCPGGVSHIDTFDYKPDLV